jgi:hypothetical protein
MLVAYRLAGLSALEAYYAGVSALPQSGVEEQQERRQDDIRSGRRDAADGARPAAQDETLEFGLLEALAQIVCGHYRNNFDFCVEMVKKRFARHNEP